MYLDHRAEKIISEKVTRYLKYETFIVMKGRIYSQWIDRIRFRGVEYGLRLIWRDPSTLIRVGEYEYILKPNIIVNIFDLTDVGFFIEIPVILYPLNKLNLEHIKMVEKLINLGCTFGENYRVYKDYLAGSVEKSTIVIEE